MKHYALKLAAALGLALLALAFGAPASAQDWFSSRSMSSYAPQVASLRADPGVMAIDKALGGKPLVSLNDVGKAVKFEHEANKNYDRQQSAGCHVAQGWVLGKSPKSAKYDAECLKRKAEDEQRRADEAKREFPSKSTPAEKRQYAGLQNPGVPYEDRPSVFVPGVLLPGTVVKALEPSQPQPLPPARVVRDARTPTAVADVPPAVVYAEDARAQAPVPTRATGRPLVLGASITTDGREASGFGLEANVGLVDMGLVQLYGRVEGRAIALHDEDKFRGEGCGGLLAAVPVTERITGLGYGCYGTANGGSKGVVTGFGTGVGASYRFDGGYSLGALARLPPGEDFQGRNIQYGLSFQKIGSIPGL